jgi:hypothetical protein
MNNNKNDDVEYLFRIICQNKKQAEEIAAQLKGLETEMKPYFKNKEKVVLSFKIMESINYKVLYQLMKDNRDLDAGIFISLVTERDSDGISVPEYVLDFYLKVGGGKMDFSFTCV